MGAKGYSVPTNVLSGPSRFLCCPTVSAGPSMSSFLLPYGVGEHLGSYRLNSDFL